MSAEETFRFPIVDTGQAPEFFCSGLGMIEPLGPNARFTFFAQRRSPHGHPEGIVNLHMIVPLGAVGPAIELTVMTLRSGLIMPVTKFIADKLFH